MPYADPEKQRAAVAAAMRKRRAKDEAFRLSENTRRREELKADPEANRQAVQRWRAANPEISREKNRAAVARHRARKAEAKA